MTEIVLDILGPPHRLLLREPSSRVLDAGPKLRLIVEGHFVNVSPLTADRVEAVPLDHPAV